MPLTDGVTVLSAGANGREVIVGHRTTFQDGNPYTGAERIDHVTGAATALPDLLAVSADSSSIVTTDFRWVDLDRGTTIPLPASVPRGDTDIVMSADGATLSARAVGAQPSWIVDIDRSAGTASASPLPMAGVVDAIATGGRYFLVGTTCTSQDSPFGTVVDCSASTRWDRRTNARTSVSAGGRFVGTGISDTGEVVSRLAGSANTAGTVVVDQPGRPPAQLMNAPSGVPTISPDGQAVIFFTLSSGFTEVDVYDRATAATQPLPGRVAIPQAGEHTDGNGVLSTDSSTYVSMDSVENSDGSTTRALLWTPVTIRRSAARVRAGEVVGLTVAGFGGVGADASAAMLSVTVTDPSADGFATVWPCGQPQPLASNLNFVAGQTRANAVLSRVGTNGSVCIASNAPINVVVDVEGWFGAASPYHALTPVRIVDTRDGPGTTTGAVATAAGLRVPIAGRGGVRGDASAVMLNVTATNALAEGFVTVWPCDARRPTASNLNIAPGATTANAVLTGLGADGAVCVSSNAAADIVIDVQGWFEPGAGYHPTTPVRLADTRNGELDTVGNQAADEPLTIVVAGTNGVDTGASAAMLNVTITNPAVPGYATVWPCDQPRPMASNVNFGGGETVAVAVLARLSASGTVCVVADTRADIIVDVDGSMPAGSPYQPLTPTRLLDTRV
ncbi:MAG: hypothetical protein JWM34_4456 [Ilumatobacteraceae bacterium]|nr:hypothetical protein [Ilumatobacteraceae bacterium]